MISLARQTVGTTPNKQSSAIASNTHKRKVESALIDLDENIYNPYEDFDSMDLDEKWNPPAQGSNARDKMPASAFLDSKNKKYPYKVKKGGKWVPSKVGLNAAKSRAAQQHKTSLVKKADNIMKRNFGGKKK